MARVLVTSPLATDIRPLLFEHELIGGDRLLSRDDLLAMVTDVEGLICLLTERIDEELLARAPRLRVIANHAVGFDNIDRAACARRGIVVANTPDVLTDATADLTFALILAVARRVLEGDALVRSGQWRGWEPTQALGFAIGGRTLGLVGMGRIGQAVARRGQGFGMRILFANRSIKSIAGATQVPLERLLDEADVLSIHCSLEPGTRGLIGTDELARMKPNAILINTARGPIVDEPALIAALAAGRLGGAGLDVYAEEPHVPEALRYEPRTVLLPHVGSATKQARTRMAELCAEAVREVLAGRTPQNQVRYA